MAKHSAPHSAPAAGSAVVVRPLVSTAAEYMGRVRTQVQGRHAR